MTHRHSNAYKHKIQTTHNTQHRTHHMVVSQGPTLVMLHFCQPLGVLGSTGQCGPSIMTVRMVEIQFRPPGGAFDTRTGRPASSHIARAHCRDARHRLGRRANNPLSHITHHAHTHTHAAHTTHTMQNTHNTTHNTQHNAHNTTHKPQHTNHNAQNTTQS
jgi:hypothetical protein